MGTRVASIAQDEEVSGPGIEELLHWAAGVCATDDRGDRALTMGSEGAACTLIKPTSLDIALDEAAVACLEYLDGLACREGLIHCGANTQLARAKALARILLKIVLAGRSLFAEA